MMGRMDVVFGRCEVREKGELGRILDLYVALRFVQHGEHARP